MRILGIDICKDRGVCWLIEQLPDDIKAYWQREKSKRSRNPKKDPMTFYFTRKGIGGLLATKPDVVALEPTGVHYSYLISQVCIQLGIDLVWVGHKQVKAERNSNLLPDKNDLADALAIATYTHKHYGKPGHFLSFDPLSVARIKELYLQLKYLTRVQNPFINRARQQLAREFPEAAGVKSNPGADGRRPLWCWIAERDRPITKRNSYWHNRYQNSVAVDYGIELSDFTRWLAGQIDELDMQVLKLEKELVHLVYSKQFQAYNQIFDQFNFGLILRSLLLAQIYPFEERFVSDSAFKCRIGAAKREDSSGSKVAWKNTTGKNCRREFYLWVVTSIAQKSRRPSSEVGQKICEYYDRLLVNHRGELAIGKTTGYTARWLYRLFKSKFK